MHHQYADQRKKGEIMLVSRDGPVMACIGEYSQQIALVLGSLPHITLRPIP